MYSTILFDFDGTLAPSLELWIEAFHFALKPYGIVLEEEILFKRVFYRPFEEVVLDLGIPSAEEFGNRVQLGLVQSFARVQLFPSALELLKWCRKVGYTTGVVTSSPRVQINLAFEKLNLNSYFDVVISGNDVPRLKPDPLPVQEALKQLNRRASETLFVGDFMVDMLAGKAAGTATALFLPDQHVRLYNFEQLRATDPDFIFSHHQELISYLENSRQQFKPESTSRL